MQYICGLFQGRLVKKTQNMTPLTVTLSLSQLEGCIDHSIVSDFFSITNYEIMSTPNVEPGTQLPLVPEDVTAQWLSTIIGHKVKTIDCTKTTLMATDSKLHLTIAYEDPDPAEDKPTHVCIKGGFNREMISQFVHVPLVGMYQKEADFYRLVAPKLSHIDLCKAYWAGKDSAQGLLVLEDLAAASRNHDIRFGEPTETWPAARVRAGVEQLAGLHAGTWGARPADYPWLVNTYDGLVLGLAGLWQTTMVDAGRPHPADWTQARLATVYEKIFARRNGDDSLPRCLIHGDPYIGNTWLTDGEAPRFLDWQLLHVGSPFHDVAYFVVGSMSVEERRAHEWAALRHYLDKLVELGGPRVEWEVAVGEYRKYALSGLGWYMTPAAMQSEERSRAMGERYVSAILDHGAVELVESEQWSQHEKK